MANNKKRSNGSSKKGRSSTGKEKENQPPNKKIRKATPPEYALVLYHDKTTGVVKIDQVSVQEGAFGNQVSKGSKCLAPGPIEMGSDSEERHEAVLIEFGYDIDFLYGLCLRTDGTITDTADDSGEIVVARRKSAAANNKAAREKQLTAIDSNLSLLTPIRGGKNRIDPENQQIASASTSTSSQTTLISEALQSQGLRSAETSIEPNTSDSNNSNGQQITPAAASITASTSTAEQSQGLNKQLSIMTSAESNTSDSNNSNSQQITPAAASTTASTSTAEQSQGLNKQLSIMTSAESNTSDSTNSNSKQVIPGHFVNPIMQFLSSTSEMKCPNTQENSCSFLDVLKQATPENMAFLNNLYGALLSHNGPIPITQLDSHTAEQQKNLHNQYRPEEGNAMKEHLNNLDCFKNGEDMMPLVKGLPVYLHKIERMSLPGVVPRSKDQKGKKKPNEPGKMFLRGVVNYLLEKLLPPFILENISVAEIPKQILFTIRVYINYNLPDGLKIFEEDVKLFAKDFLKDYNRDRSNEATRMMQKAKLYKSNLN